MNSRKVIENQRLIYDAQVKAHGDSPKSTHNQLVEIQNLRFERLLANLELTYKGNIHDIGCGICDMYQYLKDNKSNLIYSGTDIVPAMKELVSKKYPDIAYSIRNIIDENIEETYDYVVLSGTFNLPGDIDHQDWKVFTRKMILSMYSIAKRGIAFNFLTKKSDYYNDEMYYESMEDILDFCVTNLSRHVYIDHAYPLFEFSCTVLKPDIVQERYNNKTFNKYFKT